MHVSSLPSLQKDLSFLKSKGVLAVHPIRERISWAHRIMFKGLPTAKNIHLRLAGPVYKQLSDVKTLYV